MAQQGIVEVIDKTGWTKKYYLDQWITQIGGDQSNQIVLDASRGSGVSSVHAQLLYLPETGNVYRLVNLGDTYIMMGETGHQAITPLSYMDIQNGAKVQVGEFTLVFHLEGEGPGVVKEISQNFEVSLSLGRRRLTPGGKLGGSIILKNLGEAEHIQFRIELEGLPEDCYQIDSPPLMFPDMETVIPIQIYHRKTRPLAGEQQLSIRVESPKGYPGEQVVVKQTLHVLPYYEHKVKLLKSKPDVVISEKEKPELGLKDRQKIAAPKVPVSLDQAQVPEVDEQKIEEIEELPPDKKEEEVKETSKEEVVPTDSVDSQDNPDLELKDSETVVDEENIALGEEIQESQMPEVTDSQEIEVVEEDEDWWAETDEEETKDSDISTIKEHVKVIKAEMVDEDFDANLVDSGGDDSLSDVEDEWWSSEDDETSDK